MEKFWEIENIYNKVKNNMKKIIRLTESDLTRLVKRVIQEQRLSRAGNGESIISEEPISAGFTGVYVAGAAAAALLGAAMTIIASQAGNSETKVKQFIDLCKNSKAQINANSNKIADHLHDAMDQIGTDEDAIYSVFRPGANPFTAIRTMGEFCSVVKSYESSYGESLYDELESEFGSDSEWTLVFRPIRDIALKEKEATGQSGLLGQSAKTVANRTLGGGSTPTRGGK